MNTSNKNHNQRSYPSKIDPIVALYQSSEAQKGIVGTARAFGIVANSGPMRYFERQTVVSIKKYEFSIIYGLIFKCLGLWPLHKHKRYKI